MAVAGAAGAGPAACGSSTTGCPGGCGARTVASRGKSTVPHARPQVLEPTAGVQAPAVSPSDPVGNPNAHAPALSQVRSELRLEVVAARISDATYIDPLPYVNVWERTDQGVDAQMPVGAPIVAPCPVKILDVIPGWYAGQPLVYFELLDGPDAGRVQYVAEEITDIAGPGHTSSRARSSLATPRLAPRSSTAGPRSTA